MRPAGLEFANRVRLDFQTVQFGEGAFLSGVERGCELAELIEDVLDPGGLHDRPVGKWLLLGDEGGDLFEFDEVGPVREDPLSPLVLALALQEGQIGRNTWTEWFGTPFVFGGQSGNYADAVVDHLVAQRYLIDGGSGMLSIGDVAERELGRRHFMELLAVFTAPPLFSVRHGRTEVGQVPDDVLLIRPPGSADGPKVLLLAGKSWQVNSVDWQRRIIQVEPSERPGVARWIGGGAMLGGELARGVRDVLAGDTPVGVSLSRRAAAQLDELRIDRSWVRRDMSTVVVASDGRSRWWTFAGTRANTWLAALTGSVRREVSAYDGLSIMLDPGTDSTAIRAVVGQVAFPDIEMAGWISDEAIRSLKFSDCVPTGLAELEVAERLRDDRLVVSTLEQQIATYVLSDDA